MHRHSLPISTLKSHSSSDKKAYTAAHAWYVALRIYSSFISLTRVSQSASCPVVSTSHADKSQPQYTSLSTDSDNRYNRLQAFTALVPPGRPSIHNRRPPLATLTNVRRTSQDPHLISILLAMKFEESNRLGRRLILEFADPADIRGDPNSLEEAPTLCYTK
jgi:hypothetical protein